MKMSRLNLARRQLAGLFVVVMLLGGCDGVGLLATGGSSSGVNFGLSLNLDLLRFGDKSAKPDKADPPETTVDAADKPAKNGKEKAEENSEEAP